MYGIKQLLNFEYNPNVAITDTTPIIRSGESDGVKLEIAQFGLIPSWAKDRKEGAKYYNARSETVDTLKSYAQAYEERRCVIPVLGFYEWMTIATKAKIPYEVHRKDGGVISLAGIWGVVELEKETIYSFSIITGEPSELTAPLWDRTPIILHDPLAWIKTGGKEHFTPPNDNELSISRRNTAMNNAKIKDPALIDVPAEDLPAQIALF